MKNWITILGVLLVVQLGLVFWAWKPATQPGFQDAQAAFLQFSPDQIDEIRIARSKSETEEAAEVKLSKVDAGWQLTADQSPVNTSKVKTFLTDLLSLKAGWPVATTEQTARRFEVGDDNYQRKIELVTGGKVIATVLLGTSPALRKVHARLPGAENTYAVDFATFNAPVVAKDWVDTTLLQIPQDQIIGLQYNDWKAERTNDVWTLEGLESGYEVNAAAINDYAFEVASLSYEQILGTEEKPDYKFADTSTELLVTLKDGKQLTYRFARPEENSAIVKRSDSDRYFKLANYQIGKLLSTDRSKLITAAKAEALAPSDENPVSETAPEAEATLPTE